jgi:hypothetical protein
MSRLHLTIDRLVLGGLEPREAKALERALRSHLSKVLSDPSLCAEWTRSHRRPVLKLGRIPMGPGSDGIREFGRHLAHAVVQGLKR